MGGRSDLVSEAGFDGDVGESVLRATCDDLSAAESDCAYRLS